MNRTEIVPEVDSTTSRLRARIHLEVRLFEEHRLLEATRRLPVEVVDAVAAFCEELAGLSGLPSRVSLVMAEVTR